MRTDKPPLTSADLLTGGRSPGVLLPTATPDPFAGYLAWRKFRYVAAEAGLGVMEAWAIEKQRRLMTRQALGVLRWEGGEFCLNMTAQMHETLRIVDRASGVDPIDGFAEQPTAGVLRKRLRVMFSDGQLTERRRIAGAMDEAAESSIMEGAATTRRDAIELLRSGRPPRNVSERMVVNNYLAMQEVKRLLGKPLSFKMLVELQSLLTAGSLESSDEVGRLRLDSDCVRVADSRSGETEFTPPPAEALVPLLRSICAFANAEHVGDRFIHPLVKACVLHFLIGYAHPFCDGNGRTARAVFYWYALRHGYGIFEFLTISELIRQGYSRYPQAYLDCELDDGDVTYFVLYKLDVIQRALQRLEHHIQREEERIASSDRFLKFAKDLNLRQRLLLEHALRKPLTVYTVKSHMNSNGITPVTARADLDDLVRRKFMVTSKRGKEVLYMLAPGFAQKLASKLAKG